MAPDVAISAALGLTRQHVVVGTGQYRSCFAVTDLAAASVGAVGDGMAALLRALGHAPGAVTVDRRLASFWFDRSVAPMGWALPPIWDAVAGDYPCADGWIRLHTNLAHHRAAALSVLGCAATRDAVAEAVLAWPGDALEQAVVAAGGVAAFMRSRDQWLSHPQGAAVAAVPLVGWGPVWAGRPRAWGATAARPLQGLRVLDLTRVLAGPVATRVLAGFGADVLRIDPPGWDEPNVVPDVTLGKRCAVLDLRQGDGRRVFEGLLAQADVVVHGYRDGALAGLGFDQARRDALAPGALDVALNAYGWTGPWSGRRGFDSLVQMSAGIAAAGQDWAKAAKPVPLPVQALDHATGYLMAAAVLAELARGVAGQGMRRARLSLSRTAELLAMAPVVSAPTLAGLTVEDYAEPLETTVWGPARRLRPALQIAGTPLVWDRGAQALGSSVAAFATAG